MSATRWPAASPCYERQKEILEIANAQDPILIGLGGGARDMEIRVLDSPLGKMIILHLIVDTRDAMGANAVNTMAEKLAPHIEEWTGGRYTCASCPTSRTSGSSAPGARSRRRH